MGDSGASFFLQAVIYWKKEYWDAGNEKRESSFGDYGGCGPFGSTFSK